MDIGSPAKSELQLSRREMTSTCIRVVLLPLLGRARSFRCCRRQICRIGHYSDVSGAEQGEGGFLGGQERIVL